MYDMYGMKSVNRASMDTANADEVVALLRTRYWAELPNLGG